jgi:hypothetical protein
LIVGCGRDGVVLELRRAGGLMGKVRGEDVVHVKLVGHHFFRRHAEASLRKQKRVVGDDQPRIGNALLNVRAAASSAGREFNRTRRSSRLIWNIGF